MNRRGFLGSILALAAAPAIVRADSLMRIVAPETLILPAPQFCTADLAFDIDEFSQRFIQPAMARLAADLEADMIRSLQNTMPWVRA